VRHHLHDRSALQSEPDRPLPSHVALRSFIATSESWSAFTSVITPRFSKCAVVPRLHAGRWTCKCQPLAEAPASATSTLHRRVRSLEGVCDLVRVDGASALHYLSSYEYTTPGLVRHAFVLFFDTSTSRDDRHHCCSYWVRLLSEFHHHPV